MRDGPFSKLACLLKNIAQDIPHTIIMLMALNKILFVRLYYLDMYVNGMTKCANISMPTLYKHNTSTFNFLKHIQTLSA